MDPKDGKGNGPERRISTRNSVRVSMTGGDEELDFQPGLVSDGFRPPASSYGPGMESAPHPPRTPPPAQAAPSSSSPEAPLPPTSERRSSISKPHRPQDSFSSRQDGGMGPIDEASGLNRSSSRSTQSTVYVPPVDSPYRGPSGPSHPYEMYTQNVRLARTMSMTTTSTEPISESSYVGPRAPAHPYGMYTQDTSAAAGAIPVPPIPLGFHGNHNQYERRVGAEGEDIGFVGPGGHTEQLPPYTRYPDEAYVRKEREAESSTPASPIGIAVQVVRPAQTETSALPAIPGAGGLGLATRNPEFESRDDLDSPRSRHSSRSFTSDSEHEINLAAEKEGNMSEKAQPGNGRGSWLKRRVYGVVPVWCILLVAVVLIMMAAILGAVVGAFMSKEKKAARAQEPNSSSNATMPFDVVPIPTPTDLAPLPLGAFSMPITSVSRSHRGCFNDTTMAQAWQCHLVISNLKLTIAKAKKDTPGDYTASITCNTSNLVTNNMYSYGEQPFLIEKPVPLDLVSDTQEPNRGPAWYKLMKFDKVVIVPENSIKMEGDPEGNRRRIRSFGAKYSIGATDYKRKGMIPDGHKPWICTWPETYLEVFIYAQQNSSFVGMKFPSPPPPSTSSSTPNPPPPPKAEPTGGPKATAEARNRENPEKPPPTPTPPTPPNVLAAAEPSTSSSVYGPIDLENTFVPPYPRVIKIEERHMYGPAKVRCEKVEIQNEGPAKPVKGPDGKPMVVEIVETVVAKDSETTPSTEISRRSTSPLVYRDSSGDMDSRNQCSCMWFLT